MTRSREGRVALPIMPPSMITPDRLDEQPGAKIGFGYAVVLAGAALARWAVHVDGIVSGRPGKVVPLCRRA
jgi:hypothetical protein